MKPSQIIENIKQAKDNLEFIKTGFRVFDDALDGGFLRKELTILGGFTGIGKSFFVGQMFWNVISGEGGFKADYFSLEISAEMVMSRILAHLCKIKPTRLFLGSAWLTPEEFRAKEEAEAKIMVYENQMNIYDDIYRYPEIVAKIRSDKPDFVVVDFIQNVISVGDEYERMSATSLGFQQLAKETNSCILVCSQLSNMSAREGADSKTIEYKGSGAIAQVADLGLWLETEGKKDEKDRIYHLYLRKNRRGISGSRFDFKRETPSGAFVEVANYDE